MKKAQGDYSFTTLLFFAVFFLSLIGLGYYFLSDTDRFGNDKCQFNKALTCKEAIFTPEGVRLQLINMYGMDIKQVRLHLETLNQSTIQCQEDKTLGDLGNSNPTDLMILCKPEQPYTAGKIQAKMTATFQDPLLSFNDHSTQGELKLKIQTGQKTWWDKVFS
ncbi:MAG TPA: hypothetical protein VJG90_07770 [Candidatus Nanoarchaeia archaeon]|nr:hypothetical protein [Candidatus Nanoarchaeia archaeon]